MDLRKSIERKERRKVESQNLSARPAVKTSPVPFLTVQLVVNQK